jgi:pyrimidine-nucleoside phosphorylase
MRVYDIVERKRHGEELREEEIRFLVDGFTRGTVPDYQMAAWLMAVCIRGLTRAETIALTDAMRGSGASVVLPGVPRPIVDKHSTGGVGDKTTLVVAPIVAATGVPVAKMSGRGLGHTGGTLDKLESIPGLRTELTVAQFREQVASVGLAVAAQTAEIAPADKAIYALRDATATVHNIGLIAASIMGKKLAVDTDAIVLDVKVGRGAFMREADEARALAETMVAIGRAAGRQVTAVLSSMDQPLGRAVGNACEVAEAVETLRGNGPRDLRELCIELSAQMLVAAGRVDDVASARRLAEETIASGAAYAKLLRMVDAQGGDVAALEDLGRLRVAPVERMVAAPSDGVVQQLDALALGRAAVAAGAGRATRESEIDHGAGIRLHCKVGESVAAEEPLAVIRASDEERAEAAGELLDGAYEIGPEPASAPAVLLETVSV